MRPGYKRSERMERLLEETVAELVMRRIKDPRVSGVTVTGVKCTPDLRHATIYIGAGRRSRRGRQEALEGVRSALGYVRGELGRQLRLKYAPELTAEIDRSLDEAERIEGLIARLHAEGRGEDGPGEGGPEDDGAACGREEDVGREDGDGEEADGGG